MKRLDTGFDFADSIVAECKEEQDPIPIIEIKSFCSMAPPTLHPDKQVTSDDRRDKEYNTQQITQ